MLGDGDGGGAIGEDAKSRGGNAVVGIKSNYKGNETTSNDTYVCGAVSSPAAHGRAVAPQRKPLLGGPAAHIEALAVHLQQLPAVLAYPVHMAVDHQQGGDQRHDDGHMTFHALPLRRFFNAISRMLGEFFTGL